MTHSVNVSFSIINNKTEYCMAQLHSSRMEYLEGDEGFWNLLLDDLHDVFRDENNKYILDMFKTGAAISVRIAITLLEKVKTQDDSKHITDPTIVWDLELKDILYNSLNEYEMLLSKFKRYVEIFIGDVELGSFFKQAFTHNLPGCLFDQKTRSKLLTHKYHSTVKLPEVILSVLLNQQQTTPTEVVIKLDDVKGYKLTFDKKFVKDTIYDQLMVYFGSLTTKPHKITCDLNIWGVVENQPLYEKSIDGMADIISEYIKEIVHKIYNDESPEKSYNNDDYDGYDDCGNYTGSNWMGSVYNKMKG